MSHPPTPSAPLHVARVTAGDWDAAWHRCSTATAFQSRAWAEVWSAASGGVRAPAALRLETAAGAPVVFPLSAVRLMGGLATRYEASAAGTYGGWLAPEPLAPEDAAAVIAAVRQHCGGLSWLASPLAADVTLAGAGCSPCTTWMVDLAEPPEQLAARQRRAQIARKVRVAERAGLHLDRLRAGDLPAYLEIYRECRERWGSGEGGHPAAVFGGLLEAEICDFWGVYDLRRELVAAGPMLRGHGHVVSWLALARGRRLRDKPYELLYHHLLEHYRGLGLRWFDFNPSGAGGEGVDRFKRGLGAEPVVAVRLEQRSRAERLLRRARRLVGRGARG